MKRKTVFFSNFYTPYRAAVWKPLAEIIPLEIRLASEGDSGSGWDMTELPYLSELVTICKLPSINWLHVEFWIPNRAWSDLAGVSEVVLGGWESPAYWHIAHKAKRAGIKTIGFYESTSQSHRYRGGFIARVRARFFRSLDAVVTPGSAATQSLLNMGVNPNKIYQGFNVVDHDYWNQEANAGRNEFNPQNGHAFLFVGQLIERKGISDLIIAFKNCAQPNDTLRIVGKGPLHSELEELITSLDLQASVTLVGAKAGSDLAEEYSRANTLVLASHIEVWGLVVNEALASGLHVVVTKNCGVARDVQSMAGVYVVKESLQDRIPAISNQMEISRHAWSGWISEPEILVKKPTNFAQVFIKALSGENHIEMPDYGTDSNVCELTNVLWVTNVANPYRIPVWKALAQRVNLSMALLARSEKRQDWNFSENQIGLDVFFLDAPSFRKGETSIFWPNRKLHNVLKQDCETFILGGWESPAYLYALWIAKRKGIRTVLHYGSTERSHRFRVNVIKWIRSWVIRKFDSYVTYGKESTQALLSMEVKSDRIITGFNSVDHQYFFEGVNRIRVKDGHHGFKGHNYLYVGQLIERKNIQSIIRAFSSIRDEYDSLRIVGSGPEKNSLQDLITELGLVDVVVMTGPKRDEALLEEYAQANTLILASTNEVWGLVVNEALASGLHVVVSENCGVAPDVQRMDGVFVIQRSINSASSAISIQMDSSRNAWSGWITVPEILDRPISQSAVDFMNAFSAGH